MEETKTNLRPEDFEILQARAGQGDQLVRERLQEALDAMQSAYDRYLENQ